MAVKSKSDIKSTLESGDRPTQAEFGDFVDSYAPIASDGAVGFMEVISTASSIARPAETLVAIATAIQGGKLGVIEVLATADVTVLSAGAVGRELLSAIVTASAQGHIGLVPGTVGLEVFEAETTASAQGHLSIATASETIFGIVEIATQAEMEAATATDRVLTPAQAHSHPAIPKAWVSFNGTGVLAERSSYNVSSVMDNDVGDYTVFWDTDFSAADYAVVGFARSDDTISEGILSQDSDDAYAVGSFQVSVNDSGSTKIDSALVCVAAFGDQ